MDFVDTDTWGNGPGTDGAPVTPERHPSRAAAFLRSHGVECAVFLIALAARLDVILRRGGIHGIMGYDCGVYFASADALIHGRMPYRDFTLVQPPVITLVLTPFAALTRWMSDWHALSVATVAFCTLGAINAVLVVRIGRRFGLTAAASGLGGLLYATWFVVVVGEFQVKLSPLENLLFLLGLLALLRAQRREPGRARIINLLAGAALGLAMATKIWWVVPVVVLVLWHARTRHSVREGLQVAVGAAVSATAVCAPFFLAAPSEMFASIVTDQLGRERMVEPTSRITSMTTLPALHHHVAPPIVTAVDVVFVLLVLAVLLLAWRASKPVRVLVVVVVAQLVVLFISPSWFPYYADYIAVGLAVCVGAATHAPAGSRARRLRAAPSVVLTAAMVAVTATGIVTAATAIRPFAGAEQLTAAIRDVPCVTASADVVLIRLDALTRGLEAGCPNWVDVSGRQMTLPGGSAAPSSPEWDRALTDYLRSGGAVVLAYTPVPPAVARAVRRGGVLAKAGTTVIYRGKGQGPHHR